MNLLIVKKTCISFLLILFFSASFVFAEESSEVTEEQEIGLFLQKLYDSRAQLLLQYDEQLLAGYYLDDVKGSRYAKNHELHRGKYVKMWAKKRQLKFISAESKIRVIRVNKESNTMKISLIQTLKMSYQYDKQEITPQQFGMGTRHLLKLRRQNNQWFVISEWYSDPLDEDPGLIPSWKFNDSSNTETTGISRDHSNAAGTNSHRKYNREQAVEYANKYAGAAWGAGNNNRYNRKYRDYTSLGGDCTNFASQVIGDSAEGGGLPMNNMWRYWRNKGGSHSWISTDKFKDFLLNSGYARLVAKGTFSKIMKHTDQHPHGAIRDLEPGDLIAYEMEGDVDHFAVFVGLDENGYPLVNCHTADRFQVPFDLGWDRKTKYLLIHIQD